MWGTLTTISPTNPLIRWPELAKSNLGEADGGAEQRRRGERERRAREEGGGRRGHCAVRVNQGTRKLLSLDHHPNDSGWVDCWAAKTHTHTLAVKTCARTKGYCMYLSSRCWDKHAYILESLDGETTWHREHIWPSTRTHRIESVASQQAKSTCHKIKNENMASLPHR